MYILINFLYLAKNYLNIFGFTSSKFAIIVCASNQLAVIVLQEQVWEPHVKG